MKSSPAIFRMRSMMVREKRMRFSKRAAPLVVAAVVEGQPELIDHGIVGGEQFDAVEARFLARRAACTKPSMISSISFPVMA